MSLSNNKIWRKLLEVVEIGWKKLYLKAICYSDWDSLIIVNLDWSGKI
jgi:hypothetical protein